MREIIHGTFVSGEQFELVKVKTKQKREHVPAYDRIGGNMEYRSPVQGYEGLYNTFSKLSKKAHWFLWQLMIVRNSITNIAVYKAKSALESKDIAIAYKELNELNLIHRSQQQHYLMNPEAFIPKPDHYEDVLRAWEGRNK